MGGLLIMAVRDVLLIGVMLFAFGLGFFIIHYAMNTTVNSMLDISVINSSNGTVTALESIEETTNRLDYILFAVFMALVLGLIITGFLVGGHPIFMFVYLLVIIIGVVISALLANIWSEVTAAAVFGTTVSHFPITNSILTSLPLYLVVVGFIGMIAMFAKPYIYGN